MSTTTTVIVIGAGQAGLAVSSCLSAGGIDHVVLERGEVAHSWRTERWNSLRLLTPNWLGRLPGWAYDGTDPDGFSTAGELVGMLDRYCRTVGAPVRTGVTVRSVATAADGYLVRTDQGVWTGRAVVVATGAGSTPKVPALAQEIPPTVRQVVPIHYRHPGELDAGPVLVVGASASGVQLADELCRSGREVTLAVGSHTRLPRRYRGQDIHWWMERSGMLGTRHDEVDDLARARRLTSPQLVGSPDHRTLDLRTLVEQGVELVGRLAGLDGTRALCSGSLPAVCADADLKLGRLLDLIDRFVAVHDIDVPAEERPRPTRVPSPRTRLDLRDYATVVWATGLRPTYPWLDPSWLDRSGQLVHDGGVAGPPGLYVLGLPFLRTRSSGFLHGVGPDAVALTTHLAAYLDRVRIAGPQSMAATTG